MTRIKRGLAHLKHRKHLLKEAKGYKWGRKKKIKLARVAVWKAGVYSYRDRRRKKREFRQLWQLHINAACRPLGLSYSKFIFGLKKKNIELDRKVLAHLAEHYPAVFAKIVELVK